MKHHHRKCRCCKKWFTTDPRNHHHQRFCTRARCRKASKIFSHKQWLAKPKSWKLWGGAAEVERVRAWRKLIRNTGSAHFPYSTDVKLRYIDFIVATRTLLSSWTNTFQFLAGSRNEAMCMNRKNIKRRMKSAAIYVRKSTKHQQCTTSNQMVSFTNLPSGGDWKL